MTYGKLTNGKVEYFKPYRGGILVGDKIVFVLHALGVEQSHE